MMKRFLYFSFRFVYACKRKLGRRLTPAGRFALIGLLASAVVGVDTNQTVAYMAFTFLFTLFLTSFLWGLLFHTRLEIHRNLPRFGTAGETLTYRVSITNKGSHKERGLYLLENPETPIPTFEEWLRIPEPGDKVRNPFDRSIGYHRWMWLVSRKQAALAKEHPLPVLPVITPQEISAEILPLRRGSLRISSLTVACPDPLGLFKANVTLIAPQAILILPKRYPLPPIELPGTRRYQPGGVSMASSVGDSQEFFSLRDYRPGDPIRRIHWKSWAKRGKPIVQEYQEEFFVRHALILDTFQKVEESVCFEEAVSVAASFVCTVQTQESLLDLMFIGPRAFCFTAGRGVGQMDQMLEILASVRPCTDKPFDALLPLVVERAPFLSGCICVFLEWNEERIKLAALLKRLKIPLLVVVITDDKTTQPLDPGPLKDDPGSFHPLRMGRIKEELARL